MNSATSCFECPMCDGHGTVAVADYVYEPCPRCDGTGRRLCDVCGERPGVSTDVLGTLCCAECDCEPVALERVYRAVQAEPYVLRAVAP